MAKEKRSAEAQARLEKFLKSVDVAVYGTKDPYINGGSQLSGGVRTPGGGRQNKGSYRPSSGQ